MSAGKKISVIIPCFNEEKFIVQLIENLLGQDYPKDLLEIIFADGKSTDKTRDLIDGYARRFGFIKLIDNPQRLVPFALNKAILASSGEVIIRMDAHSVYPINYLSILVEKLFGHKAENVGGVWITIPGNDTRRAKAIVLATTHPLGIGNADYRLGAPGDKEVDTVPYGCFHRDLFGRIGYFDEHMFRNQDDELNGRIRKVGGKIILIPSLKIRYYARENFSKLWKMFYQYGLFKPLVNMKLGAPASIRQFAPPVFVLGICILVIASLFSTTAFYLFSAMIAIYVTAITIVSISQASLRDPVLVINTMAAFPVIHFAYGLGYIFGLVKFTMLHHHLRMKPHHIKENR